MKGIHKAIAMLLAVSLLATSAYTSDLAYAAENTGMEVLEEESLEVLSEEPEQEEPSEEPEEIVEEEPSEESEESAEEEPVEEPEESAEEEPVEESEESEEEEPVEEPEESAEEEPVEEPEESTEEEPAGEEETPVVMETAALPSLLADPPEETESGSWFVNPTEHEKTDSFGESITIAPGNNDRGDGTNTAPFYSIGKAEEKLEDGDTVYVYGEINIGSDEGESESSSAVRGTNKINDAVYSHTEGKSYTIEQRGEMSALFNVDQNSLTLQNVTLKNYEATALRISLMGGAVYLKQGLTLPERHHFYVNKLIDNKDAPIQVQVESTVANGSQVNLMVDRALAEGMIVRNASEEDGNGIRTETWNLEIPLADVSAVGMSAEDFALVGVGEEGVCVIDAIEDVDRNAELMSAEEDGKTVYRTVTNHKPHLVLRNGIVYLEADRTVVTSTHAYEGLIYVGELNGSSYWNNSSSLSKDTNDGLTPETAVHTLKAAMDLLKKYDNLAGGNSDTNPYRYPKIVLLYNRIEDVETLNFSEYSCDSAVSSYGYRASVWMYNKYSVLEIGNGGTLNLEKGVKLKGLYLSNLGETDKYDGKVKPENIIWEGYGESDSNYRYMIQAVYREAGTATLKLENAELEALSEEKSLGKTGAIACGRYGSTVNVSIIDSRIETSGTALYLNDGYRYGEVNISGDSVIRTTNSSAIVWNSGSADFKMNINLDDNGYIRSDWSNAIYGSSSVQGILEITNGLISSKSSAIYTERRSSSNQRYNINFRGGTLRTDNVSSPIVSLDLNRIFNFYGGTIDTKQDQYSVALYGGDTGYWEYARLALYGGMPTKNFQIYCDKNCGTSTPISVYTEDYNNKDELEKSIKLNLKNHTSWPDLSRVISANWSTVDSPSIIKMFDLQNDEEGQEFYGRELVRFGSCIILGIKGIFIDGATYDPDKGHGGRKFNGTTVTGDMGSPVLTFEDAQKAYNKAKQDGNLNGIQGIFILDQVDIPKGTTVTISGVQAANIEDPTNYVCNFGDLVIYDARKVNSSYGSNGSAIYLLGDLVLDEGVTLDGKLVKDPGTYSSISHFLYAKDNASLTISGALLQNLDYTASYGQQIKEKCAIALAGNAEFRMTAGELNNEVNNLVGATDRSTIEITGGLLKGYSGLKLNQYVTATIGGTAKIQQRYNGIYAESAVHLMVQDQAVVESSSGTAIDYSCNGNLPAGTTGLLVTDNASVTGSTSGINVAGGVYSDRITCRISGNASVKGLNQNGVSINSGYVVADSESTVHGKIHGFQLIGSYYVGNTYLTLGDNCTVTAEQGYAVMKPYNQELHLSGNVDLQGHEIDIYMGARTGAPPVPVFLDGELGGEDPYVIYVPGCYLGQVIVDGTGNVTDISTYQGKFVFHDSMKENLEKLGCTDINGPIPYRQEGKEQLIIAESYHLFIDPLWGRDDASGHSPEHAVRTVNGLRNILENAEELGLKYHTDGGEDLRIYLCRPFDDSQVETEYTFTYSDGSGMRYGDTKEGNHYVPCSETNVCHPYDWRFKETYTYGDGPCQMPALYLMGDEQSTSSGYFFNLTKNTFAVQLEMEHVQLIAESWNVVRNSDGKTIQYQPSGFVYMNKTNTDESNLRMRSCYLSGSISGDAITVQYNSKLSLEDTKFENISSSSSYGKVIYMMYGSGVEQEINNCIIRSNKVTYGIYAATGPKVHVGGKDTLIDMLQGDQKGGYGIFASSSTLRFDGGTIQNASWGVGLSYNTVYTQSGADTKITECQNGIYMNGNAKVAFLDGLISNCTSAGIYVVYYSDGLEVNMKGGRISGCQDGIVYWNSSSPSGVTGTIIIDGGIICDNTRYGVADIYYNASTLYCIIESGEICNNGKGIYGLRNVVMNGGSIHDNVEEGMYLVSGDLTMNGGTVSSNGKTGISASTIIMNGGTVSDNRKMGVLISNSIGSMTMNGGVIENNTGTDTGGGVYTNSMSRPFTMNGGTIRGNHAVNGGGVYSTGKVTLNGGTIEGNTASQEGDGIYHASGSKSVILAKNGGKRPQVEDTIYLSKNEGVIEVQASLKNYYKVKVNEGAGNTQFRQGSVVVKPGGGAITTAASYLTYFSLLSDSNFLNRKEVNLILAGAVFVDGEHGYGTGDSNATGADPKHAFLSFDQVLNNSFYNDHVIYVSGAAHVKNGENLSITGRTIRRYTGQPINGNSSYGAYRGPMFVIDQGGTLSLNDTIVSGRMGLGSDEEFAGEEGYLIENYGELNLDVTKNTDNTWQITKGTDRVTHTILSDNLAKGMAVAQHGIMRMSVFSQIDQMIHLGGKDVVDTVSQYQICGSDHQETPTGSYKDSVDRLVQIYNDASGSGLGYSLNLEVDNPYNGRPVSEYSGLKKDTNLQIEKDAYAIRNLDDTGLLLTYEDKTLNDADPMRQIQMKLIRPGIYYVDGSRGSNENDGKTPKKSFKTLERAYKALADDADSADEAIRTKGGLIYIVGTVEIPDGTSITYSNETGSTLSISSESYPTMGDVVIRRYSRPDAPSDAEGYAVDSFKGTMLKMSDGAEGITLEGVTLDGHSQPLESSEPNLKAPAVEANGPILEVPSDAMLILGARNAVRDTLLQNNVSSGNGGLISCAGTLNIIGNVQDSYYDEERDEYISQPATILQKAGAENGGAIYIEDFGQIHMSGSMLRDCTAEEKGSAVYAKPLASLTFRSYVEGQKLYPNVDGVIYLGGNKTKFENEGNSSCLIVDGATQITERQYELEVQDAYDQRNVVWYDNSPALTAEDIRDYIVYGKDDYHVAIGSGPITSKALILTKPNAVYINGVSGSDEADGMTPRTAVATLKTAYEKLRDLEGGVLYVVDTVTISNIESLSENSYSKFGIPEITVDGTVTVKRYVRPSAYGDGATWTSGDMENYAVKSNKNALFTVTTGGILTLENIVLDGHKEAVYQHDTLSYKTNAGAIEADAPLIQVMSGKLNLGQGAVLQNNMNLSTPSAADISRGKIPGGAIYNAGTVVVTGGTVSGNICKDTFPKTYTVPVEGSTPETVTVTPDASGIWQAGTMTVNVSDASALHWEDKQYIYLAEQSYDSTVTDVAGKDAKVSFLNVQALPTDTVLPLDLSRDGAKDSNSDGTADTASGWFAPGRKVVEMVTEGSVTAENFTVNGGSFVGIWMEGSSALTEKLVLGEREESATVLELQRPVSDCIIDVIVPVKEEAGSSTITNLSKKAVKASGAVTPDKEIGARTGNGGKSEQVTIDRSEIKWVKISCSDGQ